MPETTDDTSDPVGITPADIDGIPMRPALERAEALKEKAESDDSELTRFDALAAIAGDYGDRSFRNYAQIRNVAESLRDRLRDYLCATGDCVYLVPPRGGFGAKNYGSGAFSVAGKGFLPLEPLSFGLAVRVSDRKDYIRIVMTCRKEADALYATPDNSRPQRLSLPPTDAELTEMCETLYQYLLDWFASRIDRYDNGSYGSNDIGFDIIQAAE